MSSPAWTHELDAVVVGAGGAGLYAALELKKDLGADARVGPLPSGETLRLVVGATPKEDVVGGGGLAVARQRNP
jgi:pyruvate/2-oxoglutarate dehydrogenase complex dihydrolipoamide dehydrogenase (E3) component